MSDKQYETTGGPADHWRTAQAAAELLLAAWQDPAKAIPALPDALRPRDESQAYAIQQAVMPALGRVGGWKVSASTPGADAHFACAPMPLTNFHEISHEGRAHLPATAATRGVEAEICFRLKQDLETRAAPYTREEIVDAIDGCHPAIEVLGSRFAGAQPPDPLCALADFNTHGAFVFGAPVAGWRSLDFARETGRMLVDGAEFARSTGNPAGEMLRMLVWLANAGTRWAGGLRAGQVVTCGSWSGKAPVRPGTIARAVFEGAGAVEVAFG